MAKANPTRPDAPADESSVGHGGDLPDTSGPPLEDPRSRAAMDNIGVDDQAGLLDAGLDDIRATATPASHRSPTMCAATARPDSGPKSASGAALVLLGQHLDAVAAAQRAG